MPHVLAQDLRNAVLQAAMQGKLSKQLKDDSSVDQLLIDIEKQKNSLINKKEMKKEKPLSLITDEEIPFDIPPHWEFVRTGNVIDCSSGSTPLKGHPEYYENGTIPWLKTGELNNSYITKCEEKITELAYKKGSFRMNQPGDVLIAMYGATIGKLGICTFPLTTNQACLGCTPLGGINNRYLFYFFMASKSSLTDKAEGGAQPNISRIKVRNHPMPLPPIEEQARIVARVDELMAKIDEYEKIENELTELQKAFPGAMKDAVLQAALTGLLSETHQEDTAVTLTIDESIKSLSPFKWKSKTDTSITDVLDLIGDPEIPDTWTWVKLKDIAYSYIGLTYSPANKSSDGTLVLRSSNIKNGKMDYSDVVRVDMDVPKNKICEVGDILMCSRNGSKSLVGKTAIIDKPDMAFGAFMAIIKSQFNRYLFVFFNSYMFKKQMHINSSTETINQITQDMLWNCVIPFPPIEEQQRIVNKLDQLLPLCEQLDKLAN